MSPRRKLTPEELAEVNQTRSRKANAAKSAAVDRRLASRLTAHGWTVHTPTGDLWQHSDYDHAANWHRY
jgi:hypothetical protein